MRQIRQVASIPYQRQLFDGVSPAFVWSACAAVGMGSVGCLSQCIVPLWRLRNRRFAGCVKNFDKDVTPVDVTDVLRLLKLEDKMVCIVGTTGTGKTTFLKYMSTLQDVKYPIFISCDDSAMFMDDKPVCIKDVVANRVVSKWGWDMGGMAFQKFMWKRLGMRPTLLLDVTTKNPKFNAAEFRAEVKELCTGIDSQFSVVITASDGLLFAGLSLEPRLETFTVTELSEGDAKKFLCFLHPAKSLHFYKLPKEVLQYCPRTLLSLHGLPVDENWDKVVAHLSAKVDTVVKAVRGAFKNSKGGKELLQMALDQDEVLWDQIEKFCCDEYPDQDTFDREVVKKHSLFYANSPASYKVQFDQTREAIRRAMKEM